MPDRAYLHPLSRKLRSIFPLNDEESAAVEALAADICELKAGETIVREGDRPSRSCLVLAGITSACQFTPDGKRQILTFHVAGDMPDLQSLHLRVLDSSIIAETPCRVAFIQHEALRRLCDDQPRITSALWRATLIDAARFRQWLTNIGRRNSYERMAHLLCEHMTRLQAVGLADGHQCPFPITQAKLADALGMSHVHVNRTLKELRADGLVELKSGTLTIKMWKRLAEAGQFDRTYLHIERIAADG